MTDMKGLAKKIEAREKFLKKVIDFVEKLVIERGEITEKVQGSCHTNIKRRLFNFGDFSFLTDRGQTMFGGNECKIWYHPKNEAGDIREGSLVLSVYYQCESEKNNNCRVDVFNENHAWQSAINYAMSHKDKIVAKISKKEQERRDKSRNNANELERMTRLQEKAKRLKI